MDDEVGSLVEKLKPQFVTKWLKTVCDVRFDVMVMCLLPKPVEFARVRRDSDLHILNCLYGFGLSSDCMCVCVCVRAYRWAAIGINPAVQFHS